MLRKVFLLGLLLGCCVSVSQAQIQRVYDVIPTDNFTSLEFNPSLQVIDHATSTSRSAFTMKGNYKFTPYLSLGTEIPFVRYESPAVSKNGLGDVTVSLTAGHYQMGDKWSCGAVLESIWPTATSDVLGSGKVQLNPSLYAVYMPTKNWFIAGGYKQHWSVAGDGGRDNINNARLRLVLAYLSDTQWWVLLDPRYIIDYDQKGKAQFAPEAEIGTMVNTGTAVYLRVGGKVAGNMPGSDWTVSTGFKVLYL